MLDCEVTHDIFDRKTKENGRIGVPPLQLDLVLDRFVRTVQIVILEKIDN